jgi:hypothetical protein
MNRPRHLANLLLIAAFAAVQLLATAPLLHPNCNPLALLTQGSAPANVHTPEGTAGRTAEECPICMVSGLAAVLAPRLAVSAPAVHAIRPLPPAVADLRSPAGENLRSRAPPSA